MNWYIAKIIFQIKGKGMQRPQFDEHLRLIEANGFEEAFLKARILGINSEDSVINNNHGPVKWEFVNVSDLRAIEKWQDGLELHSQVREMEEENHYIDYVHNQAASMQLSARPPF
ncbi:MAG TPA: DUF4288 domain-containing protein [Cyclobacteriaceae bacterium]|nr:DUF4288 domain-containing protein [Cyclobacteriaceae bacterium]